MDPNIKTLYVNILKYKARYSNIYSEGSGIYLGRVRTYRGVEEPMVMKLWKKK